MTTSKRYTGVLWRENKDGQKTFYIRYKNDGKNICIPVSATSEKEASDMRTAKLAEKIAEALPKESTYTIGNLWREYVSLVGGKTKRYSVDKARYNKYIEDRFGDCYPEELTTQVVDKFRRTLIGLKPATVQNILELLRRIINFGVRQGLCEQPRKLVFNMPKFDNLKTEMFTEEQTQRYLDALAKDSDKVGTTFLRILMLTGMRSSALCGLLWTDIDFENGIINIRPENAKNGSTAHIVMADAVKELFQSLPRINDWCFPGKHGGHRRDFRKTSNRIKKAAGLPADYRPTYSLRHNFASQLASSGQVDLYTIQRALTQKSVAMTQRYAHLSDQAAKRASEIAAKIIQ